MLFWSLLSDLQGLHFYWPGKYFVVARWYWIYELPVACAGSSLRDPATTLGGYINHHQDISLGDACGPRSTLQFLIRY
jgi:hypothetical protein